MAGLAHDAAHFFKFLFILVLYTLAMTLFVRLLPSISILHYHLTYARHTELPPRLCLPQRRYRHPGLRTDRTVPDDVRRVLRPLGRHPASSPLAPVALSAEVYPRGTLGERGRLGAHDRGRAAGRAYQRLRGPHYANSKQLSLTSLQRRADLL